MSSLEEEYAQIEIETSAEGLEHCLEHQEHTLDNAAGAKRNYRSMVRPLVREHPLSGRCALYVGARVSLRVLGWTEDETGEFIQLLTEYACQPAYQYRHRWRVGDAVLWDNRRVLHACTPYDMNNTRRRMYRTAWRESEPIQS